MSLRHEQAQQYLHMGQARLTAEERVALTAHLFNCAACRAYADDLDRLQPALTRALQARPVPPHPASPDMTAALKIRQRRVKMRQRSLNVAGALLGMTLLMVFGLFAMRSVEGQNTLAGSTARPTTATLQAPVEPLEVATETTSPSPAMPPTAVVPLTPAVVDQRVDIGVATLHIRCMGRGTPTVILNSGPGTGWSAWGLVMTDVATFTRVCAYDRAGLGGSTRGPKPRTSQQMADELAALLDKGQIPGPYVLVSHSTSNWIDRLYTAQHRDQVAALVLVSPFHEDMISGTLAILAPYPSDLATTRAEFASQGEGQSVEDWLTSADQVRAAGNLGDLPLVLLARSAFTSTEPYGAQIDAMLAHQQQQLLALSTNSTRLVAEKSGHFIYSAQPRAVVEAIGLALDKISNKNSTGADRFEPNDDFEHATPIELGVAYDNLNFAQPDTAANGDSWDNDYFKVEIEIGKVTTCRTFNLSPGTDTNLILYDFGRNGIEGNDNVDPATTDKRSEVTVVPAFNGWLYILVGEGFYRPPDRAAQATYSLECSQAP